MTNSTYAAGKRFKNHRFFGDRLCTLLRLLDSDRLPWRRYAKVVGC